MVSSGSLAQQVVVFSRKTAVFTARQARAHRARRACRWACTGAEMEEGERVHLRVKEASQPNKVLQHHEEEGTEKQK